MVNDKDTIQEGDKEAKEKQEETFTKKQVQFLLRQQEEQIRRAKEEERKAEEKAKNNSSNYSPTNLVRHPQADEINIDTEVPSLEEGTVPMENMTTEFMNIFKSHIEADGMLDKTAFNRDQIEFGATGLVIEDYVMKHPELAKLPDIEDFMKGNWKGICERYVSSERFTHEGLIKTGMFQGEDLSNINLKNDVRYVQMSRELGRKY